MKSPITGKEMALVCEDRTLVFRKEEFSIAYRYYRCVDTGEQFTTTELDELNLTQLQNHYRVKHNLPFPDEIRAIREQYGLSYAKMSDALGFGINVYRSYEGGEVPSDSNGKLITLAADPQKFKTLVEWNTTLPADVKRRLMQKIEQLVAERNVSGGYCDIDRFLFGELRPDEFSGYRAPSLAKLREMVVFFAEKLSPWKTGLNKLLFYADFLAFNRTGFSISGIRYKAIELGPVPNSYEALFEYAEERGDVRVNVTLFDDGGTGERFLSAADRKCNREVFDDVELGLLESVARRFEGVSSKEIVDISHQEPAWIENHGEGRRFISYNYALSLRALT
jgi:putative zinc finger/helix-turn-helix YgiT family protein